MERDEVRQRVRDRMPEPGAPAPDPLTAARQFQVLARRAEAAQQTAMLEHQDTVEAQERIAELPLHARREARKVPVHQLALDLRMSERTVAVLLSCARFARRELPQMWRAFGEGAVDQQRLRLVADAAVGLESADHVEALDAAAAKKAPESTAVQLRRWLNRYVARLGPEEFARSCEHAQQHRHVHLQHLENGVILLQALLPTVLGRRHREAPPCRRAGPGLAAAAGARSCGDAGPFPWSDQRGLRSDRPRRHRLRPAASRPADARSARG